MAEITIPKGATLSGIAKQQGTTTAELLKINPQITNPNLIIAGAQLNIPDIAETKVDVPSSLPQEEITREAQDIPDVPVQDTADSFVAGVQQQQRTLQDQIEEITRQTTEPVQAQQAGLREEALAAIEDLRGRGERQLELEAQAGVPESTKRLQELNLQIAQLTGEFDRQAAALEGQGRGITTPILAGQEARIRRQKAVEVGALATVAQAVQGNIALAQQTAQRTVDLEFEGAENDLLRLQTQLDFISDDLTAAEKKRAEKVQFVIDSEKNKIEEEKQEKLTIFDIATNAVQNGADNRTVQRILDSDTKEDALQAGATYLGPQPEQLSQLDKLKIENQQLQNDKLRQDLNQLPNNLTGQNATLDQFASALIGQESGGNYNAVNERTGASGAFQIMPANWGPWSQEAGLPAGAAQTPENQNKVANFKLQQYFNKYGNWKDVASVWYSGRPFYQVEAEGWADRRQGPTGAEPSVRQYVNSVLARLPKENIILEEKEARKENKDLSKSTAYESLRTAKNTWNLLSTYDELFKEVGNQKFGKEAVRLRTAYNAVLLDMKELFNLGVLNGPDLELMENILVNPNINVVADPIKFKSVGGEAGIQAGIDQAKTFIAERIDNNYNDIKTTYQDYSAEQLTNLQNVDKFYNDYLNSASNGDRITVKEISTGRTGTILANEFDPKIYQKVN